LELYLRPQASKGLYLEGSYIGRIARHLLATRDVMALNNIVDPKSGMDWYTAAGQLEAFRVNKTALGSIPKIAFFENMYAPGSIDAAEFGLGLTNTQAVYALAALNSTTRAAVAIAVTLEMIGRCPGHSRSRHQAPLFPQSVRCALSLWHDWKFGLPRGHGKHSAAPQDTDVGF